ncbi:hypothetical protein H0E84_08845 [Luteimonas sp. SJ-92]|uniref:DUF5666 domain-containing protein n=2 Tax=Luteimonas salinisoli TaxID=2752307 RepID=A0A853JB90_9GAMM|nr:hypothetical protein [Luteimonas salinisoli]
MRRRVGEIETRDAKPVAGGPPERLERSGRATATTGLSRPPGAYGSSTEIQEPAMNATIRYLGIMLAASALLFAGCASLGDYGGYPGSSGQPEPGYPSQYGSQLQGTVDGIDTRYRRIFLVVDDPRSGRAQRAEVRYDQRTRLMYQGREHPVEGLERGDVIRVDVAESGRELWARSVQVVRNVREGGYGGGHGRELRGSIAFVDTRARLIGLDSGGYGNSLQLRYDGRTTVEYQGRRYRPEDMQRGDFVRIQARELGRNEWLAERILVERSAGR